MMQKSMAMVALVALLACLAGAEAREFESCSVGDKVAVVKSVTIPGCPEEGPCVFNASQEYTFSAVIVPTVTIKEPMVEAVRANVWARGPARIHGMDEPAPAGKEQHVNFKFMISYPEPLKEWNFSVYEEDTPNKPHFCVKFQAKVDN